METVRRRLSSLPALRRVFDHCVDRFSRSGEHGLGLKGSLKTGEVDVYSDIDFALAVPDASRLAEARDWVREVVCSAGRPLATFPATHLGMENLLIFFLETGGAVVKVDVGVLTREELLTGPDALILHDPGGLLSVPRDAGPSGPPRDFSDLHQKFSGWVWYTYTKIGRGELLEAVDSLSTMRSWALLPCLQLAEGLPVEGYRRLEQRLPAGSLASLRRTFPASLERAELLRCLEEMIALFAGLQPRVAERLGWDHRAGAGDLDSLAEAVRRPPTR